VTGDLRRNLPLDRQQRIVAVGADKEMKDVLDPLQRPAAELQRPDRIAEVGGIGAAGDSRDLGVMLGEGLSIGRTEMLGPDLRERRNPLTGRPGR
jgi:hypothetical protein